MLRSEIVLGVKQIGEIVEAAGLMKAISSARQRDGADAGALFAAFQKLSVAAAEFGPVERHIFTTLDLSELLLPQWWASLTAARGTDDRALSAAHMYRRLDFAKENLPVLLELLVRESDGSVANLANELVPASRDDGRFVLILPEASGRLSSPQRVTSAIDSVVILYEVMADILNASRTDLALVSCDSGSNKIFDFKGLAQVVEKITELIVTVWNKVVYHREEKQQKKAELIAHSLPIIEQLTEMERENKISPEHAELYRRRIVDGVCKFLDAGALIPQIEAQSRQEPAKLMRPKETLLIAGPGRDTNSVKEEGNSPVVHRPLNKAESDDDETLPQLTEAEIAALVAEARRRKGKRQD